MPNHQESKKHRKWNKQTSIPKPNSRSSNFNKYSPAIGLALTLFLLVMPMTPFWRMIIWLGILGSLLFPVWHSDWKPLTVFRRISISVLAIIAVVLIAWQTWPPVISVSPARIKVSSSVWTRIHVVTVTNHEDNPRYGLHFIVEPSTSDIDYTVEGPITFGGRYSDNSQFFPIQMIGPKSSYMFQIKSRLKSNNDSHDAELRFKVTQGADDPGITGFVYKDSN